MEKKTTSINSETQIENEWIEVKRWGNEWSGQSLYVNPAIESAKIYEFEITHWGYHDESDWDERESIISIEQALSMVYPDETAVSVILDNLNKDYSKIVEELRVRGEKTNACD